MELAQSALLRERMARCPLWDPATYVGLNGDVGSSDGLEHFLRWGAWQAERPIWSWRQTSRFLGQVGEAQTPSDSTEVSGSASAGSVSVTVYVSSLGGSLMAEVADVFAEALTAAGADVRRGDERGPWSPEGVPIVVAPHDFFTRGRGAELATQAVLESCVLYAPGHLLTRNFRAAFPYLLSARAAICDSPATQMLVDASGTACVFHRPEFGPDVETGEARAGALADPLAPGLRRRVLEHHPTNVWADRPLDVLFSGGISPTRTEFLTKQSAVLADLECVIDYRRGHPTSNTAAREANRAPFTRFLARRSKVLLNLHWGAVGGFDWPRMALLGVRQGAVLVTQELLPDPVYRPGMHYFQETSRRLPELIRWLLSEEDGRKAAEEAVANVRRLHAEGADARRSSGALLRFLSQHGASEER